MKITKLKNSLLLFCFTLSLGLHLGAWGIFQKDSLLMRAFYCGPVISLRACHLYQETCPTQDSVPEAQPDKGYTVVLGESFSVEEYSKTEQEGGKNTQDSQGEVVGEFCDVQEESFESSPDVPGEDILQALPIVGIKAFSEAFTLPEDVSEIVQGDQEEVQREYQTITAEMLCDEAVLEESALPCTVEHLPAESGWKQGQWGEFRWEDLPTALDGEDPQALTLFLQSHGVPASGEVHRSEHSSYYDHVTLSCGSVFTSCYGASPPEKFLTDPYHGLATDFMLDDWSDAIQCKASCIPSSDGQTYHFSLELSSNSELEKWTFPQTYWFVIDRVTVMEKGKSQTYQKAVARILKSLRPEERFNIIFLDKQAQFFAQESVPATKEKVTEALSFLSQGERLSRFSIADAFSSLFTCIQDNLDQFQKGGNIFFFSGGKGKDLQQRRRLLLNAIPQKYSQGRLPLHFYTVTFGQDNDLASLGLLSYLTGGSLIYSDTSSGFVRKILQGLKQLQSPLLDVSEISFHVKSLHTPGRLDPIGRYYPTMYTNQKYILTGSIQDPTLCRLEIVGKSQGRDVFISKEISLVDACFQERDFTHYFFRKNIYDGYESFLNTGDPGSLREVGKQMGLSSQKFWMFR